MRICIISKFLPPKATDGIPRNRWEYAKQFVKLGHEVHIISSGVLHGEQFREGIYIHEVPLWDNDIFQSLFANGNYSTEAKHNLCYSYLVQQRIRKLNELSPIDIIDSPLWDIEGYITKIKLPHVPMVVRLETTSMLMREILEEKFPDKNQLNDIETHFLQLADGFVMDSWSILQETERLYQFNFNTKPYAVIYHGIDTQLVSEKHAVRISPANKKFKIIAVGRLEKRKGTDILITHILSALLQKHPDVEIHFMGGDNADWDGFKVKNGCTYSEYLKRNFEPNINKTVFIHGYVSDEELEKHYDTADTVFALSRYESFGLLYVEAMKKAKPIIAFNTGAVPEIFEHQKNALIVPIDKPLEVVNAVTTLKSNPEFADSLGKNARIKLSEKFNANRMGKECITFFADLLEPIDKKEIYQVMNCLTDRDGVSNITMDYDNHFKTNFQSGHILSTWATEQVQSLTKTIESVKTEYNDIVLYHYWNYCDRGGYFNNLLLPAKIFVFHNITSPYFFEKDDDAYLSTSKGFGQLPIFDNFDVYVGFSNYSVKLLQQAIPTAKNTAVIPPIVDKVKLLSHSYDHGIVKSYKKQNKLNILFVGSIAPHKKQTDLVEFFAYYLKNVNSKSHLIIAGGGAEKYTIRLKKLIRLLELEDDVTLTGKIPDNELYSYYRVADVYLSMSEHEGFGVPLAEAMAFDIPVVAYNCTAVGETIGISDFLFSEKKPQHIADIIEKIRTQNAIKESLIRNQQLQLQRFSPEAVTEAFTKLFNTAAKQQRNRLNKQMMKDGIFHSDVLLFDSPNLVKSDDWQLKKGEFLFTKDPKKASYLSFSGKFTHLQLQFISHDWSGQIKIVIDEVFEQTVDLFDINNHVNTIKIEETFAASFHDVVISVIPETNENSKGREIFFLNASLKYPLRKLSEKIGTLINSSTKFLNISKEAKDNPQQENEYHLPEFIDIRKPGTVLFDKTLPYNSDAITYHGKWEVKDDSYTMSKDFSGSSFAETELYFTRLSLQLINHNWSGIIKVTIDGSFEYIFNLFDYGNSVKNILIPNEFTASTHHVRIEPINQKDNRSFGHEVLLKSITPIWQETAAISHKILELDYKISVVINTLNRGVYLKKLLDSLQKQTYPFFEVIVVNGPSTDSTAIVLAEYKNKIKIGHCEEANLSKSRNIGIELSSGNWVAFIDDDAIPGDKYWLESFVNYIILNKNKNIGIVGGPVKHRDTENFEFKEGATSDYAEQIFRSEDITKVKVDGKKWIQGVRGANNIILKKALYEIGGFDERFVYYLDETDICFSIARKGYAILNHPTNYVRHYSGNGEFRKSQFDLKWDVICRSDTYFCLKTARDKFLIRLTKTLNNFRKKHFFKDIGNAYKQKAITAKEYRRYKKLMRSGLLQGISLGVFGEKGINYLQESNKIFKPFNVLDDPIKNFKSKNSVSPQKNLYKSSDKKKGSINA